MAKAALKTLKKKVPDQAVTKLGEVRHYARRIWLAGLGAYYKVGKEGYEYFKDLVQAGEVVEKRGLKRLDRELDAANTQIDELAEDIEVAKGRFELQVERIESAFDRRVASALNRIGIPSKHDVDTLSVKLEELTTLVEKHVAKKR